MKKDIGLCGLGNSLVDVQIYATDEDILKLNLNKGEMRLVDMKEQKKLIKHFNKKIDNKSSGGSAANTIIAFSKFGGKAAYMSVLGNDDMGNFYINEFKELGIQLAYYQIEDIPSGTCLVIITPDSERTMCTYLGATGTFNESHLNEDLISRAKWLYIEGYQFSSEASTRAVFKAIEMAKTHKTKIAITFSDVFIINQFKDNLEKALRESDLIFCNEAEALAYTKKYETLPAIKGIQQITKNSVITLGAGGSVINWAGQLLQIPAYPAKPIDSTGAGDIFAGALIYGLLYSESGEIAGNLASYSAAKIVSQLGARLQENHKEIRNYIFSKFAK